MSRADLEFELLEQFDAERLSVYADFLQAEGDPRGELIALDLAEHDDPARHDELVVAWLGDAIAMLVGPDAISVGFVQDLELDGDHADAGARLSAVLASRAAPYIRGITIRGTRTWIAIAFAALSELRLAWLDQLSVQLRDGSDPNVPATPDLAAFAPNLARLEAWGPAVLGDIAHPTIRSVAITHTNAIASLYGSGPLLLPKLGLLDIAFHDEFEHPEDFTTTRLRNVRRLDLSRNEPGLMLPHYLGGTTDAYAFLDRIGIRNQLVHVRMPSIRTRAQERRLVTTLAAMPRLQDLDIVRNYRDLPYVEVPEGVRMAPPWPWLPADLQANYRVRVRATADRVAPGIAVDASELVIWLETVLDELDPAIAATWTRILDWTSSLVIERASLAAALDAIDADIMPSWIPVRTALSAFAADVERVFVDVWDLI